MTQGPQDNPRLAPIRSQSHRSLGASAPSDQPLTRPHVPISRPAPGRLRAVLVRLAAPTRGGTGIP